MNKYLLMLAALALLPWTLVMGQDARDEDPAPALSDLAWLEGHWSTTQGGVRMEEWWTAPAGGVLLGLHRDVRVQTDGLMGFEYLRIEAHSGGVRYIASPGGGASTAFELVEVEGQLATFENLEHDFPQRIIYQRTDTTLTARIEDASGKRGMQWRWELE